MSEMVAYETKFSTNKTKENAMRTQIMMVDPAMARAWLGSNFSNNRRLNKERVNFYAKQMAVGQWKLTHQGIAISTTGQLLDGQHRLHAVIQSGATVAMMVTFDLEESAMTEVDNGQARNISQRLRIAGVAIDNVILSVANRMRRGISKNQHRFTVPELQKFLDDYLEGIDSAITEVPAKVQGIGNSHVRAAVARAYYHLETEVVSDFCHTLKEGQSKTGRSIRPAFLLAQWSASHAVRSLAGANEVGIKLYMLTENALMHFDRGQETKTLKAVERELFPLPFDEEGISRAVPNTTLINKEIADEIRKLVDSGITHSQVARRLKISRTTVSNIINGKSWT